MRRSRSTRGEPLRLLRKRAVMPRTSSRRSRRRRQRVAAKFAVDPLARSEQNQTCCLPIDKERVAHDDDGSLPATCSRPVPRGRRQAVTVEDRRPAPRQVILLASEPEHLLISCQSLSETDGPAPEMPDLDSVIISQSMRQTWEEGKKRTNHKA